MNTTDLRELPDYENIQKFLEVERKALIKVHSFSDTDEFIRTNEDAEIILNFMKEVQNELHNCFKEFPSLTGLFTQEFVPYNEFISRENVVESIFLDDCLFPEKELMFFGQDGGINPTVLEIHKNHFKKWVADKAHHHRETQGILKEKFDLELKSKDLTCQCVQCLADYRTRVREIIYDDCVQIIETTKHQLSVQVDKGLGEVTLVYQNLLRGMERKFQQASHRLKKSSLNRLESQVKALVEETFTYPSEISLLHTRNLIPFFQGLLIADGYSAELVTDDEYRKFFRQLGSNIWRNDRYLEKEFKKLTKSVLVLKRKDISSTILQDYLGQFWIHTNARKIQRRIVYHKGPTNSGKTYHAIEALAKARKGCYLAPLRLLAAELYDTLNSKNVKTTLLTGEEVIELEGATHYSSTIEMAKLHENFDCAVIDEIQMITDKQRGWAWTRALVNLQAFEVHLCGDGSVLELVKQIVELCGDVLEVKEYNRMTSLSIEERPITLAQLEKHDALIVFSRRNALKYKYDLEQLGFKVSIIYGMLSPEVRREQARKFDKGLTDVIVSTDAISMGMNLPIQRIVFSTLTKHINGQEYPITPSEIKQIAGRAGRFQRFPHGKVSCLTKCEDGIGEIQNALEMTLEQQTQSMVGPDLDIYTKVNNALEANNLPRLKLSEFLRLFNTMNFTKPFYCVDLREMIELAETVEDIDFEGKLSISEIFGFSCAPVNLGLMEHVQYFVWILKKFVVAESITNEPINFNSNEIDYLETSIKCVELFQWLARHFSNKNFSFSEADLLDNKLKAIDKLNTLLSDKITPTCSSCGCKLPDKSKFPICDECFKQRRFGRRNVYGRENANKDNGASGDIYPVGQGGGGGDRFKPRSFRDGSSGAAGGQSRDGGGGGNRRFSKKRKFQGKPKK